MPEMDLSGLRAYAQEMSKQFEALRANLGEMQRELNELSVSITSADGWVTATVGARGQLQKLQLDPRIYRRPDSAALARLITQTIQQAVVDAAAKAKEITDRRAPGADVDGLMQGELARRMSRFDFIADQIAGGADRER